jgi:hypothetical protein
MHMIAIIPLGLCTLEYMIMMLEVSVLWACRYSFLSPHTMGIHAESWSKGRDVLRLCAVVEI